MPITEFLERNARDFGDEVALVELNPRLPEERKFVKLPIGCFLPYKDTTGL